MISQVITWSITLVVIRLLTPADYGLLAMAMVFVSFLAMFSELGLGAAVVQKGELDEPLLRRVFGVILVIHFSLAALLALSAPLIANFYSEPRVVPVIRVLALQFVLAAFAVLPDAQLQRRMEFRNRSLLDLSGSIVASLTTLSIAFGGGGVWALVVGSILRQAWKTVGINWLSPFRHWPVFSVTGLKSLLRFGGHFSAAQVLWMLFSQADILICAKILGNQVLGFYSVAMHLASLPNQRISGLVNQVAFPAFSSMQHDIHRIGKNVLSGVRILSFVAFITLWGVSSVAPEIIKLVLGEKWISSSLTLQVLALVMPLRMVGNFVATAVQGVGRSDVPLRNAMWSLLIGPILFFVGAYWWGLLGLSLAWLLVSPLLFLQGALRGSPTLGLRWTQLVVAMWRPALAGGFMYATVAVVREVIPLEISLPLRLFVFVISGALGYFGISYLLNRQGIQEVFSMFKGIVTAKRESADGPAT